MANKPSVSWSETTPAGSESLSLGDNRIREMKSQLREILAQNHEMSASGQGENWGKHNKVELIEQADLGTGAEGLPILGAMTSGGKAELAFVTEDDDVILITEDGKLGNSATSVVFKDIDVKESIGVSGAVSIGGALSVEGAMSALAGLKLTESTAPSTAANVGALYTKNDGTETACYFREESNGDEIQITKGGRVNVGFGAYETTDASQVGGTGATLQFGASTGAATTYQAAKDGFIILKKTNSNANLQYYNVYVNTDGETWNASTRRVYLNIGVHLGNNSQAICCPVGKGEYWKAVLYQDGGSTADLVVEFKPIS